MNLPSEAPAHPPPQLKTYLPLFDPNELMHAMRTCQHLPVVTIGHQWVTKNIKALTDLSPDFQN